MKTKRQDDTLQKDFLTNLLFLSAWKGRFHVVFLLYLHNNLLYSHEDLKSVKCDLITSVSSQYVRSHLASQCFSTRVWSDLLWLDLTSSLYMWINTHVFLFCKDQMCCLQLSEQQQYPTRWDKRTHFLQKESNNLTYKTCRIYKKAQIIKTCNGFSQNFWTFCSNSQNYVIQEFVGNKEVVYTYVLLFTLFVKFKMFGFNEMLSSLIWFD